MGSDVEKLVPQLPDAAAIASLLKEHPGILHVSQAELHALAAAYLEQWPGGRCGTLKHNMA
jgi:hypothetical protein